MLTSLPAFQTWEAGVASRYLAEKTGTRVYIEKMRLNILGRIVLDNVKIYDQRDTLMLKASRIAAKIDIIHLIDKKIRISGAQLIGARAKLYKDGDKPSNIQFFLDAFLSKDTTSTPLDLGISALVVRRGELCFDRLDKPATPGRFNPSHLHLTDLNLTARILARMPDTLAINLRNLSLNEQSGLCMKRLSCEAKAGKYSASIRDLQLELPETVLQFTIHNSSQNSCADETLFANKFPFEGRWEGSASGSLCPRDLLCFAPQLAMFEDVVNISSDSKLENGNLRFPNLSVSDNDGNLSMLLDATFVSLQNNPSLHAKIIELSTGPSLQQFLTKNLQGLARELSPILTHLGSTNSSGTIVYQNKDLRSNLTMKSEQGTLSLDGYLNNMENFDATISATDIKLGHLLALSDEERGTILSLEANLTGTLPKKDKATKLAVDGLISSLTHKGYEHRNIRFSAAIDGETYSGEMAIGAPFTQDQSEESNRQVQLSLLTEKQQGKRSLHCQAQMKDFSPHDMKLTKRYEGEQFSGSLEADFSDIDLNNLQGEFHFTNLELTSEKKGNLKVGDIEFTSNMAEDGMHLRFKSDAIRARADGSFNWKTLAASFTRPIRQNLPSLFPLGSRHPEPTGNNFRFVILVEDTLLAERLLDSDLRLPTRSWLDGNINDASGQIALQLHIPQLMTGSQFLQNITCRAEAGESALQTSLQFERIMKGKPVELNFDAYATGDKVTSRLRWDNKRKAAHTGDISMTGIIRRDPFDQTAVDVKMNTSRVVIGDTLWNIMPATIKYHDKVIDVENLSISQARKHINIGGRISDLDSDTLKAELADIDISYIMDLVNFHNVDFDGRATGSIYATSLMKKPFADAFLQVKDFTFNAANLGSMDLYANWGRQERAILLEADMRGPVPLHKTQLHGTIIPGKGEKDGLDLNIETTHFDLSFLNKFTKDIFRDLQGRTSGWARVFGPFKTVNLEGDLLINEMKMHVPAIGTDYHLAGDSIWLRPDNIWLRATRIYDKVGLPGMNEHMATVDAHLMHNALKDLSFDININAHNLLGYNFPHQGGTSYYGTAYADAQVHLYGNPGTTTIDVNAIPMPGTSFTYNVAAPGTITETEFVTYGPLSPTISKGDGDGISEEFATPMKGEEAPTNSDLRVNLTIDVNPNAQIRLLMDPRTGDNIMLYGNGHLQAKHYNKGHFQLFGTYRVSEGNYHMSIRDLITKDFVFQPDGTIVFSGNAMQAGLNLKATHTVHNVSLDDLSPTGLGLSNTRVDCIMNIGGRAEDPVISFDFDIPNANEDEKQMVRSMLSSEEERDMQAIYLLGVGRFYTYGTLLDTKQSKGTMAMNSVLSSALSSRFNQIMSQALGGTGWSFGTNLRTGEEGWEQVDAEALVSGKMLSGRLLFNGNFGYRENKYKMNTGNFIGDFDIQYRLSPRSPFSLKAYNQTNDRYFTQSSLTTQGIGIKFQRDFSRWLELFHRIKKKGANQ